MKEYEQKLGIKEINGDLCHELLAQRMRPKLAFDVDKDYKEWKCRLRDKLTELLGLEEIAMNACEAEFKIEKSVKKEGYKEIRFIFNSEKGATVPCYILIPENSKGKLPVCITLQGHSSGFHNSIGVPKSEKDEEYIKRGDFGRQAVRNNFIALCIEQRGMGERATKRHSFTPMMCTYPAMTAQLLGRTILGERVWDIMRAIDILGNFKEADTDKIIITGNSGGGTMSFYAACIDERIKISVPSCAFCTYYHSLIHQFHCPCNFLPGALKWFDMPDLAALIAPRSLIVVAGKEDNIFLIEGVEKAMSTVKRIFEIEGVADNCSLVITQKGHWWCHDIVWEAVNRECKKLGWKK